MALKKSLFYLLAFLFVLASVEAWTGNFCSRRVCRYRYRRVCSYRLWFWGCCAWKTIREGYWVTEYYCCPGWTDRSDQNCNKPICWPNCDNEGVCTLPGKCSCPSTHTGYRCRTAVCSYNSPCFPGVCSSGENCDCSSGFTTYPVGDKQNYCLKIEDDSADMRMTEMQVRLSYWKRGASPPMEQHWIMADSTDQPSMDIFWTNRRDFNRLETTATSQYFPPKLTDYPPYITETGFGVVDGKIEVWLTKLPPAGSSTPFVSLNATYNCLELVSSTNPETDIYNCSIVRSNFDRVLENGDHMKIKFLSSGGGYRKVKNLDTGAIHGIQSYDPVQRDLAVKFRFDFDLPFHCQETQTCTGSETVLKVPDITRVNPITMEWEGWQDRDSGMFRYVWEVFAMTAFTSSSDNQHHLDVQPDTGVSPLVHTEVMDATYRSQSFTLPGPGMYSVVLEAGDLANNTKYARRLVLFDPDPRVTSDPQHALYVSTASPAADYRYQNDVTDPIVVSWEGHFRNAFHEDNHLLAKVRRFPIGVEDGTTIGGARRFWKVIELESPLDDHEGERTVDAIPNKRGIVKFSIQTAEDSDGGVNQPAEPTGPWTDIGLNTSYQVPMPSKTETVTIWVKAQDVMGEVKVNRTQVSFDDTPPQEEKGIQFHMNVHVPGIDFSSKFTLQTKDKESGIAYIVWTFTRVSNNTVIYTQKLPGVRVPSCTSFTDCDCTLSRECFSFLQTFAVSNCHMMVEKSSLATEQINVTADITNMAGLVTRLSMLKEDLTQLNGTEAYYPPQNITVISVTTDSVTLTWSFPPSCFPRTALWVLVGGEKLAVHKDAQEFAVTGLDAGTAYTVSMVTDYEGGEQSSPAVVQFVTVEKEGLGVGAIVGIVIGVLLLLLLVTLILMFVLWQRGVIFQKEGTVNSQMERVSRAFTHVRKTIRGGAFQNNAYRADGEAEGVAAARGGKKGIEMDEIYLYGAMAFNSRPDWHLESDGLTLLEQVSEGRFATVYKASCYLQGKQKTVAAKLLKSGFNEDDAMKMMAKINFMATQLDDHANVIRFLGAVTDNSGWGPVLVMEYCETGQMDRWLVQRRTNMSEQVMENLFRFCYGIAKGMEYIASKKITHKRLAARNILLNFLLEPKVAGFGPQHKEGEEDKATRVPAKWAAPEMLQEKPATEKSDVWSYGVVLWEIFSMGQVPYPGIHAAEIGTHLKSGFRMDRPEFADDTYYELMQECWQYKQSKRPTFSTIRAKLDKLFTGGVRQSGDFYYDTKELGS